MQNHVVPEPDRLIDAGKLFFLQTRTLDSSATRYLLIRTGTKKLNLVVSVDVELGCQINLIEAPATVSGLSALVARNFNRNLPDDGLLSKAYTITGYTGGTNISPSLAGFGSNHGNATSGITNEPLKYKLKPNTDYVYEVDPDGSTAMDTKARSIGWEDDE